MAGNNRQTAQGCGTRAGMTLVEVLVAGTMGALLLMSMAAALGNVFDSYAAGMGESERCRKASSCLDAIRKSIRRAESASSASAYSNRLTDPEGQSISYAWSGTAGDPLTEQIDAGSPVTLVESVKVLSFSIIQGDISETSTSFTNEELIYFNSYSVDEDRSTFYISEEDIYGIEFVVPKSETIEKINLTRLDLRVGRNHSQYEDLVLVLSESYAANKPRPFPLVLSSQVIPNNEIPYAVWDHYEGWLFYYASFDLDSGFSIYPNRHYCFALKSDGSSVSCMGRIWWLEDDPGPDNGIRGIYSNDMGLSWKPTQSSGLEHMVDMPFRLFGDIITTEETTTTADTSVDVKLSIEQGGEELSFSCREFLKGGILDQ